MIGGSGGATWARATGKPGVMRKLGAVVGALAALGLIAAASAAGAMTLIVRYSEDGFPGDPGIKYSFNQLSNPTPISYADGYYTQVAISNGTGVYAGLTSTVWYSTSYSIILGDYMPQVYTGPESAPVFAPGVFDTYDPADGLTGSLTISLPEPSSWAMMLVGFGGLGAAMRSRRKRASTIV